MPGYKDASIAKTRWGQIRKKKMGGGGGAEGGIDRLRRPRRRMHQRRPTAMEVPRSAARLAKRALVTTMREMVMTASRRRMLHLRIPETW